MIFNKKIANVILLAPKAGVVSLGRNAVRWESYTYTMTDPSSQKVSRGRKVTVFIDNIKIGSYDVMWLREYAKG